MRKKGKATGVSSKSESDAPGLKVASEGGSFEDPVIGQTLDGTIVSWNTAAERLIGYLGQEIIGRNILTVIPPDLVGESNLVLDRIRNGETVQDFETVRLRKDGTRVNVSIQAGPVRDERGDVIGATVVVRDISDRKKLEETLTRSDVNYRLLAEKSRIGIVVVQDGIIRFVNPWGADTIGHTAADLLSSSFVDVVHPDDRPLAMTHLSRVEARQPGPSTRTIRIIDRSGEVSWMSIHSTPFSWEGHHASLNFLVDVTNRVLVRDEMRKSWEDSADALLVVDRGGVVQFVNKGAARLFERRTEEMTGKAFEFPLVMDHPTEIEIATDLGTREFAEMRVIWAEWDEKPAYLVSLKNITEQKRVEEDLKNSEEIYRRFVSTMNDGAWFIDSKGITRFVNTKMSEMLGYTPDEMQEKPFFSFVDRRFQKISKVWLQRRRQGIKEKNEFELIRKDGNIIYSIVSTAPIANKFGKYMGSIAVVVDITDKKHAVEALQKSEEKYRALVENSTDLIARLDRNCRFLYANPAYSNVVNIPSGSLLGRTFRELDFSEEDANSWDECIDAVYRTGKPVEKQIPLTASGDEKIIDWRLVPEFDSSGEVSTVLSIGRDITRMKRAEEKIRHLASFTQLNPNPILELDRSGAIIFANVATRLALRRIGQDENAVKLFLPLDIAGILKELDQGNVGLFYREVEMGGSVFAENIYLTPNAATIWIYISDITEQKRNERPGQWGRG